MSTVSESEATVRKLGWTLTGLIAALAVVIVLWYQFGMPSQEHDERIAGIWRSIDVPSLQITLNHEGGYDIERNAGITEEIGIWSTKDNSTLILDSTSEDPAKHTSLGYRVQSNRLTLAAPGLFEGAKEFKLSDSRD